MTIQLRKGITEQELELLRELGLFRSETETKVCTKCGEEKLLKQFGLHKSYSDGRRTWCRDCCLQDHKRYFQENKERISRRTAAYQREHPREYWSYSTYNGHRSRGCEILFDRHYLIDLAYKTDNCPICGCELNWGFIGKNGSPMRNSPTLDRINQTKVLTKETVQIVCARCNMSKNARNMPEFIEYCKSIAERF